MSDSSSDSKVPGSLSYCLNTKGFKALAIFVSSNDLSWQHIQTLFSWYFICRNRTRNRGPKKKKEGKKQREEVAYENWLRQLLRSQKKELRFLFKFIERNAVQSRHFRLDFPDHLSPGILLNCAISLADWLRSMKITVNEDFNNRDWGYLFGLLINGHIIRNPPHTLNLLLEGNPDLTIGSAIDIVQGLLILSGLQTLPNGCNITS